MLPGHAVGRAVRWTRESSCCWIGRRRTVADPPRVVSPSLRYDLPRTLTDHMTDILTTLIDEAGSVSPEVRKILLDQFDRDRPVSSRFFDAARLVFVF